MRQEVDSIVKWAIVILREEDVGGRERVTTDEERVARGAEQRSGCADGWAVVYLQVEYVKKGAC